MNANFESVALIRKISRDIRTTGHCMIADARLDLIVGGALDLQFKMHRLRSFAEKFGWKAVPLRQGRAALFYPQGKSHPATATGVH